MKSDEQRRSRAITRAAKGETATSGQRRILVPRPETVLPETDTPTERYAAVGGPIDLLEAEPTRVGVVAVTAEARRSDRPPAPAANKPPRVASANATQRYGVVAVPIEAPPPASAPATSSRAREMELTAVDASASRREPTLRVPRIGDALPTWLILLIALALALTALALALAVR